MTVDEAYAYCRAITHKHGANFSVGFRFLPPLKKRAVYAAYAFCRVADDIADEDDLSSRAKGPGTARDDDRLSSRAKSRDLGGSGTASLTAHPDPSTDARDDKLEALDAWQRELDACYSGRPSHPITIALADALHHFDIPKEAFLALIAGCRQDTVKTRYETFDELLHYCDLVATSISDISLSIFGYRTDAAPTHGRNLSTALQLTNVTRDIGDDTKRDRVYLPQEELRRFGVTEEEIFAKRESDRMRRLIEFQIERAEGYFRAAEPLLAELEFDARFPTLLMGGVYATVLAKLRKDPLIALHRRLSLSAAQKLLVIGRRMLKQHFV